MACINLNTRIPKSIRTTMGDFLFCTIRHLARITERSSLRLDIPCKTIYRWSLKLFEGYSAQVFALHAIRLCRGQADDSALKGSLDQQRIALF